MKELKLLFGDREFEILKLLASRLPEQDLETLIYSMLNREVERVSEFDLKVKEAVLNGKQC